MVGVEDILGGLDATPRAGPLLSHGVFGPDKEMKGEVAELVARLLYHGQRLGFVEAGQVEEVGVLTEGKEDGAGAPLDFGRGKDGNGIFGEGLR